MIFGKYNNNSKVSKKTDGVAVDRKLLTDDKQHIRHTQTKVKCFNIEQSQTVLEYNTLCTLYCSRVFPYTYCIEIWGNNWKTMSPLHITE